VRDGVGKECAPQKVSAAYQVGEKRLFVDVTVEPELQGTVSED
jgi:hypothetical protein